MSWHDDMMITNGISKEIGGLRLVTEPDELLRTTEVGLRLVAYKMSLSDKMARQVA